MAAGSRVAVEQLRAQYKMAHDVLENTVQGVQGEQLHWTPQGKGGTIGGEYVHAVISEDFLIHAMSGGAPLVMSAYAGRAGMSEPPPIGDWGTWGKTVKVDRNQAAEYAAAVYASTDNFLAGISDADLAREVDVSSVGLGVMTWGALLNLMAVHAGWHTGEISALKGMQGLQGYPF